MKYILYILLGFLLFRFVARFLIPVYKTGKHIKKQFSNMQQQMQDNMQRQAGTTPPPSQQAAESKPVGEYIDFEEVK